VSETKQSTVPLDRMFSLETVASNVRRILRPNPPTRNIRVPIRIAVEEGRGETGMLKKYSKEYRMPDVPATSRPARPT